MVVFHLWAEWRYHHIKLSDIKVKTAKPNDPPSKAPRKLADGEGLYLWVMPSGKKYWRLKYRIQGKPKELALGVYPEITLKEARNRKYEARRLIAQNKDPVLEKKKQKLLAEEHYTTTFEVVSRQWYENRKSMWKPRYAQEVIKRLEEDIFPHIGFYPIRDIEPPILLEVIRKIEKRGAHDLAKRQLQKCGEIFRFAIAEGKATYDPSRDLSSALKPVKTQHFASIDTAELPEFLAEMRSNRARLHRTTLNALNLMLLTFVRTNELINAKWEEFDFDREQWLIPAARMKMAKDHIVPLSAQAISVLEDQKEAAGHWEHVFPSPVKPQKSISNNTILGAIKRMGYQGRMTSHGFRSLAMSTIKQELGYRHEVVDRQLAHVPQSKINRAYDRAMFLNERKQMMQEWADYLEDI